MPLPYADTNLSGLDFPGAYDQILQAMRALGGFIEPGMTAVGEPRVGGYANNVPPNMEMLLSSIAPPQAGPPIQQPSTNIGALIASMGKSLPVDRSENISPSGIAKTPSPAQAAAAAAGREQEFPTSFLDRFPQGHVMELEPQKKRLGLLDRFREWRDQPGVREAMLKAGLAMLQPIQPGQTRLGHIAGSVSGGVDYLAQLRAQQTKQQTEQKRLGLEERQVAAAEKKATPTKAEEAEREARAALLREQAGYYGRSTGRGRTDKLPATREEFEKQMSVLTTKARLAGTVFPEDLPDIKADIQAEADRLYGPSGGAPATKKPWPKTSQEAIVEIQKANPQGLSPQDVAAIEGELARRYPDYVPGSLAPKRSTPKGVPYGPGGGSVP